MTSCDARLAVAAPALTSLPAVLQSNPSFTPTVMCSPRLSAHPSRRIHPLFEGLGWLACSACQRSPHLASICSQCVTRHARAIITLACMYSPCLSTCALACTGPLCQARLVRMLVYQHACPIDEVQLMVQSDRVKCRCARISFAKPPCQKVKYTRWNLVLVHPSIYLHLFLSCLSLLPPPSPGSSPSSFHLFHHFPLPKDNSQLYQGRLRAGP